MPRSIDEMTDQTESLARRFEDFERELVLLETGGLREPSVAVLEGPRAAGALSEAVRGAENERPFPVINRSDPGTSGEAARQRCSVE